MNNLLGSSIFGYDVTEIIGAGAFGTVYKVEKYNPTGRYVRALKHIQVPTKTEYNYVLNSLGGDVVNTDLYFEKQLEEITSEVNILNDFTERNLPNIVHYFENEVTIEENPRHYNIFILMEYLTPLDDLLMKSSFTVENVIYLGLDILSGLSATHENGVIHRDIKIDNIFYSDHTNGFKIGDFGVSKILGGESRARSIKGTPDFIAPEVYLGKESYTNSVDLYSLGIVLFRLLNYNRNPFLPNYPISYYPQDEDEAFHKRLQLEQVPLPSLGGEKIGRVIQKALADRNNRYQSAQEFYDDLIQAADETPEEELQVVVNEDRNLFFKEKKVNINSDNWDIELSDSQNESEIPVIKREAVEPVYSEPEPEPAPAPAPREVVEYRPTNVIVPSETPSQKKPVLFWIIGLLFFGFLSLFLVQMYLTNLRNTNVPAPVYSVSGGDYNTPQNIEILDDNPDVTIYYTTDGTTPTKDSILYNPGDSIHISSTTVLKSIAVNQSDHTSPVTSVEYRISTNKY